MASAHLYDAVITFLGGDSGDLRSSVNSDAGSTLLVVGSVNVQRDRPGPFPRDGKTPDVSVEIVRGPVVADVGVGVGCVKSVVVLDLYCTVRRKDTPKGQAHIAVLEQLKLALRRRYQGVSNLSITATGASFVGSSAEVRVHDVDPAVTDSARAIVRASFSFVEQLADNA